MLLLLGLMACTDADYDGFAAQDDCDDGDATVYPGAPDVPGDEVDQDCDGADAVHAFVGDWALVDLEATYFSYTAFIPGSGAGDLEIGEDMVVEMELEATLDPELAGQAIPLELELGGDASALSGPGSAMLYLEGNVLGNDAYADLRCALNLDELLWCEGAMLTFEINLEVTAVFER